MASESAVEFATTSRIHVALAVKDLEQSRRFYRSLFGHGPTKERPRYAKFEVAEPPVNLALNESSVPSAPANAVAHFGVQVKSTAAVKEIAARLEANGYPLVPEDHVTCCYAVQNKVWAVDPDGNKWEIYVLLDDDGGSHASTASRSLSMAGCCTPTSLTAAVVAECCEV
ncbi:MAG TPA: ArsI/CadI family heavy metal resistance metalloenzyme [Fimbriiglobus sp.]|jgi:catechol 2,3-dioxygenase-like lactoylglutathione lyase family enzyme